MKWRAQWRVCWSSPTTMWRLKAALLPRYNAGIYIQLFTVHTREKRDIQNTNITLYCIAFIVHSSIRSSVSFFCECVCGRERSLVRSDAIMLHFVWHKQQRSTTLVIRLAHSHLIFLFFCFCFMLCVHFVHCSSFI